MMHIRLGPIALGVCSLLVYGLLDFHGAVHAQQKPSTDKPAAAAQPTPEQQDQQTLSSLVDAVANGSQQPPGGIGVSWVGNQFIKSQGDSVYIPFTIAIDKAQLGSSPAALYVRVVSKTATTLSLGGARPTYPWDTLNFIEVPADGRVSRAIALPPGTYDAYIAVKDKGQASGAPASAPKLGLVRRELMVPALTDKELATSSVILARALEQLTAPLPPEKQQENPYVFGPLKVTPAFDNTFTNASDLQVLFWIYGASQTGGKPDVVVEFNFYQRLADGEKYFNKTMPQEMNEKTLPPEFNLTAGHQLLSSLAIPLKSFPPGNYRLEIKVTDKPTSKTLTRDANFTVSAS